jgi:hypothetical protein
LSVACGGNGGGDDGPEVDCSAAVPSYSEVEVFQPAGNLCVQCHSSSLSGQARNGAPITVNVDTYESASMVADLIVDALSDGVMPPEGYTITEAQKQQVYQWALCGTPD